MINLLTSAFSPCLLVNFCTLSCNLFALERSLELFYKLFLINTMKREATQLCPFVKLGVMHRKFQPHLRPNGRGIDYSKLETFETATELENILANQRKPAEEGLSHAIKNGSDQGSWEWMLENARRVKIDKYNPELYKQALAAFESFRSAH